jgi:hypothetical protein
VSPVVAGRGPAFGRAEPRIRSDHVVFDSSGLLDVPLRRLPVVESGDVIVRMPDANGNSAVDEDEAELRQEQHPADDEDRL